jgi:hypothetical protein
MYTHEMTISGLMEHVNNISTHQVRIELGAFKISVVNKSTGRGPLPSLFHKRKTEKGIG